MIYIELKIFNMTTNLGKLTQLHHLHGFYTISVMTQMFERKNCYAPHSSFKFVTHEQGRIPLLFTDF